MKKERIQYCYDVHNHCENCGRYYRVDIKEETQKNYPARHVVCPYCGHVMQGKVQKTKKGMVGAMSKLKMDMNPFSV